MSPQFHVVFDDEFTLVPAMRSRTVPANWADLVSKSSESVSNSSVDTSKVWFNQMHSDPDDPASGLDALIPTVTNAIESNLPAQAPEAINITETPPLLPAESETPLQELPTSEGDRNHDVTLSTACEGEVPVLTPKDYLKNECISSV